MSVAFNIHLAMFITPKPLKNLSTVNRILLKSLVKDLVRLCGRFSKQETKSQHIFRSFKLFITTLLVQYNNSTKTQHYNQTLTYKLIPPEKLVHDNLY